MGVRTASELGDVLADGAKVEQLSDQFTFTEGPTAEAPGGAVLFSDLPESVIYRFDGQAFTEYRRPSGRSNGLHMLPDGRLLSCEHDTSTITLTGPDGESVIIASQYDGKGLNSPNDVTPRGDGSLYFTDPPFGRVAYWGLERRQELDFQGVFRIPAIGEPAVLLADDFEGPNGICFSPDETRLYVSDTARNHIRAFDVDDRGGLAGGSIFYAQERAEEDEPGLDGLKADELGNIYCGGPGGVLVLRPDGSPLGSISVPEDVCANLTWGGRDGLDLYMTAGPSLYRVRMKVRSGARA